MSKIKFKKEVLGLVDELTNINKSLVFEKDEKDSIIVKRKDPEETIAYVLSASNDSFAFDDEEIGFYDYSEFHRLLNVFDEPEMEMEKDRIIISEKKSKINYLLSDTELIKNKKSFGKVKFENPDVVLKLSMAQLKNIKKMVNLINAEKINFLSKDDDIKIRCYSDSFKNSWEDTYEMEKLSENVDIITLSKIFEVIPLNDYVIEIKKEGIIKFSLNGDYVNLDLFIAKING